MANRDSIWVDGPRPDGTTLDIVNTMPVTHLASHPHVGAEEIKAGTTGKAEAVGYDMEGVLLRFGETEVSDDVLSWLDDEQSAHKLARFIITACRDYEKVQSWIRQMKQVGMPVYHAHRLNYDIDPTARIVDKSLKKPEPALYLRAAVELGFVKTRATFVGDKLSDAKGAMAAGYSASVLTPRLGEADHFGDRLVTRRKQIKFMNDNILEFPRLEEAA
jgi:hypothetical protein